VKKVSPDTQPTHIFLRVSKNRDIVSDTISCECQKMEMLFEMFAIFGGSSFSALGHADPRPCLCVLRGSVALLLRRRMSGRESGECGLGVGLRKRGKGDGEMEGWRWEVRDMK
jgi:hypothetical protein